MWLREYTIAFYVGSTMDACLYVYIMSSTNSEIAHILRIVKIIPNIVGVIRTRYSQNIYHSCANCVFSSVQLNLSAIAHSSRYNSKDNPVPTILT